MNALITRPGEIASLKKEMDRLFGHVMDGDWFHLAMDGAWNPPLDLVETKDAVVCRIDVPGMEPKDIHVTLREDILSIRGEKKMEKETEDDTCYRLERRYGTFSRSLRLPAPVDGSKVNAVFKDGLLTITIPKRKDVLGETEVPIRIP